MSTPAGWYPDPTGRHGNRWFDGNDWTDQVADGQTVGVDPVHGGGPAATAAAAGATQVVPVGPTVPAPPPGAPGTAPTGAPVAAAAPPPGAPLGNYSSPTGPASSGGNKTWLIVAAVVVVLLVVGGLVVALGGGDDGDSTASSSTADDETDQSDAPDDDEVDEDPSVSDLFDDMAGEGDQNDGDVFGTDEEDDGSETTVPDGEYPPEVIDNFIGSCTSAGSPASFCGCVIDELQANVPYDRFVEIDQELAANPDDIPSELTDAAAACQ